MTSTIADEPRARQAYWLTWLGVLVVTAVPIAITRFPPLHDYTNHLGRAYILFHLHDVPAFDHMYQADWRPYPNLALDLILVGLQRFMPIEMASKVFLIAVAVALHTGAHFLGREIHGRPTWFAPYLLFFFYGTFFFYGLVNYLFGVGMFLATFAVWLGAWRTNDVWRYVAAAAMLVVTYFVHLSAFTFFGISAGVWALLHVRRVGVLGAALRLAPCVLPAVIWRLSDLPRPTGATVFDGVLGKVKGVVMLLSTYDWRYDLFVVLLFASAFLLLVWRGRLRVQWSVAVVGLTLIAAFLAAPYQVDGVTPVDRRYLLPGVALFVLALRIDVPRARAGIAFALAIAVILARTTFVALVWSSLGGRIATCVELMDRIPRGSRVLGFAFLDGRDLTRWTYDMAFWYLQGYAAIERDAAPWGMFTMRQPIVARPVSTPIPEPTPDVPPESLDWRTLFQSFDSFWGFRVNPPYLSFLRTHCGIVATADEATVFRDCHL